MSLAENIQVKLPGRHPHYKEALSEAIGARINDLEQERDRLGRQVDVLEGSFKLALNQMQLAQSELKRLAETQVLMGGQINELSADLFKVMKRLPAPDLNGNGGEDELKGQ